MLMIDRNMNAIAGRAIGTERTRMGANVWLERIAEMAAMRNVIFASGMDPSNGTHSDTFPTMTASRSATHLTDKDARCCGGIKADCPTPEIAGAVIFA